jgi:hypothetical protein
MRKEKSKIGTMDLWIPSKKNRDMFKPDYLNFNLVVNDGSEIKEDYLHFCWAECYPEQNDVNFYSESLFVGVGNIIYCFNEESCWIRRIDSEIEGWTEINYNPIVFEDIIMDNFFVLHEETPKESISSGNEITIDDEVEIEKFKELTLLLIACTNLEIANTRITCEEELVEFVSDKIGHTFKHFGRSEDDTIRF